MFLTKIEPALKQLPTFTLSNDDECPFSSAGNNKQGGKEGGVGEVEG